MSNKQSGQHQAWASGDAADEYFRRNRPKLNADESPARSTLLYAGYLKSGDRVLEIGTANGWVLEQLRRLTGCEPYGMDPSHEAVADGRIRHPALQLSVGTADKIDYPDAFFQAVLFGFCLYLLDRTLLMRAVAESDRVLCDSGRLMITDFDPVTPHRRPFMHQKGTWSYKMQYPALWLGNPGYILAEKISYSHHGDTFHPDASERVASWILVKRNEDAYPEQL